MPKPIRIPPHLLVRNGFCRQEVQKVLRKYYENGKPHASAWTCLTTFESVLRLQNKEFHPLAEKGKVAKTEFFQGLVFLIKKYPSLFFELITAVSKSEARIKSLSPKSPERLIESEFRKLIDIQKHRKLAEALPNVSAAVHDQVRKRISVTTKTANFWIREIKNGPGLVSRPNRRTKKIDIHEQAAE